ncbi:MAG: hypothetical protein BZY81_00910 [SAR202 cluster bacterium Io17-Chloro-G4]|nr:MAG: hypothetical protein BZY81_00910 [SAR202 cluster bacterium Io17-Chloro-G4]
MRQSAVSFKVKGLSFEGVVAQPDEHNGSIPGVVICHPHPLYGGNMENNVVLSLSFALAQQGFVTLRFNFRGVGNSEGEHTKGELETEEALGALDLVKAWPGVDSRRIGLAGYSFGSRVVLNNPELHKNARAFALVSPSLVNLEATELKRYDHPAFVIVGDQDKSFKSEEYIPALDAFSHPPGRVVVAGADHFWYGYEDQLAPPVVEFFTGALE